MSKNPKSKIKNQKKIKTAVVGVGYMGQHHARIYAEIPNSQLVAIADLNEQAGIEMASKYKAKYYNDFKDMVEKEKPDAVSVSTPTAYHAPITIWLLQKGINVLLEKPIASDIFEAAQIVAADRDSSGKLMVGHIEWFNPVIIKIVDLIKEGKFGEIRALEAERLNPYPQGRDDAVGIINDLGTHDIHYLRKIALLIGKKPNGIFAVGGTSGLIPNKKENYAHIVFDIDDIAITCSTSWIYPFKKRVLHVVGDKGTAVCDLELKKIEFFPANSRSYKVNSLPYDYVAPDMYTIGVQREEPLRLEIKAFLDSVSKGSEIPISSEEAFEVLKIAKDATEKVNGRSDE
ncbi:MAG: Gfo/Idh/MocA family oxidoreductase [Candidatus Woykebacteria bacterium]